MDEDFDKFINLCECKATEWVECHKSEKVIVSRRPDPEKKTSIDIIRIQAYLDVPATLVVEVLEHSKYRQVWDDRLLANGLIEKLDESNNIK